MLRRIAPLLGLHIPESGVQPEGSAAGIADAPVALHLPGVVERLPAKAALAPLVVASPHSGACYPAGFKFVCSAHALRQTEDTAVDRLAGGAPGAGASLVRALFPRAYIDPNRAPDDLDPLLIEGDWQGPINPSDKSLRGVGLIRRVCRPGVLVHDRRLSAAEIRHRIERYWWPYIDMLEATLAGHQHVCGQVWLLDMHSMPSGQMIQKLTGMGVERTDIVLGDRDETSCDPAFTRFVAGRLRGLGYSVAVNDPYKGVEIARRFGQPQAGRHVLQIELNRRLYMDEETLRPHTGFGRLRRDLTALFRATAEWGRARLYAAAAD